MDGYSKNDWKTLEGVLKLNFDSLFDLLDDVGEEDLYAPIPEHIEHLNIMLDMSHSMFRDKLTNDDLLWEAFQFCLSNAVSPNDILILRSLLMKELFANINARTQKTRKI